jgi:hypothetical protein
MQTLFTGIYDKGIKVINENNNHKNKAFKKDVNFITVNF